jgi:hypothetical protein
VNAPAPCTQVLGVLLLPVPDVPGTLPAQDLLVHLWSSGHRRVLRAVQCVELRLVAVVKGDAVDLQNVCKRGQLEPPLSKKLQTAGQKLILTRLTKR